MNRWMMIFLMTCAQFKGQDLHFSQFLQNHAILNPALTGATESFRALAVYREQWRSVTTPFRSYGVSFETRANTSGWKQVENQSMTFRERGIGRLAWGLSVYNDRAGTGKLNTTLMQLSISTFVPLSKKQFLSVGVQPSFTQRTLENGRLTFPSQYNGSTYDPNLPQNEKLIDVNHDYFGMAGGLLWSFGQEQKRIAYQRQLKARMGASVYHLFVPDKGFYANTTFTQPRWVAHGDLYWLPGNSILALHPSFMYQVQGSASECIAGVGWTFLFAQSTRYTGLVKRSTITLGTYYRFGDAMIASLQFEREEQYIIGISYDVNGSKLTRASSMRGALEVTLCYVPPKAFLFQKKAAQEK